MKIDSGFLNTLQRAYQSQPNPEVVPKTNSNTVSAPGDEVIISTEGLSRSLNQELASEIESQNEGFPQNPLPDDPKKSESTRKN